MGTRARLDCGSAGSRHGGPRNVDHRRKGVAQEPYINHLVEAASLVAEATGGSAPNGVIAALLHEAVEDQGIASETISERFGQHSRAE